MDQLINIILSKSVWLLLLQQLRNRQIPHKKGLSGAANQPPVFLNALVLKYKIIRLKTMIPVRVIKLKSEKQRP
jgi:hypothetical protein